MGICVAQGQGKAGANQYSFLERRGAHNTSGAALGAENTDVHRPASVFEEFTDQQRGEGWMETAFQGGLGWTALGRDQPEESFPMG